MSRTRQRRRERIEQEPPVRCMAVTFPKGGAITYQVTDWDRLVYASEGAMRVMAAEREWMVPPHRALWVPLGIRQSLSATGKLSLRILYVRPDVGRDLPRDCRVVNVSALLRELILHIARRAAADPQLTRDAHAVGLLLDQIRGIEAVPLQLPMPSDARALRAVHLLMTAAGTRRSLASVARAAAASPRTLQRLFAAETGLTFERWRQRSRLVRSIELLSAGGKVTSVAFDVGYDSPSAFIAMFRRELGQTPRRYLG